jgi:hypothetical protein
MLSLQLSEISQRSLQRNEAKQKQEFGLEQTQVTRHLKERVKKGGNFDLT